MHRNGRGPVAVCNVDYYENTTRAQFQSTPPLPVYQSLKEDSLIYESMYTVASPGRPGKVPGVAKRPNGHVDCHGNVYAGLQDSNREQHVYTALGKQ